MTEHEAPSGRANHAPEAARKDLFASPFPLFEMIVNGKACWLPLRDAGITYDSGFVRVEIGGDVLDGPGAVRQITSKERARIADFADEWSAAK